MRAAEDETEMEMHTLLEDEGAEYDVEGGDGVFDEYGDPTASSVGHLLMLRGNAPLPF